MQQEFLTGINYWPAAKAMFWWPRFDDGEVREDFKKLAAYNLHLVRIFLTWEDFQPRPDQISISALDKLRRTCDLAARYGLKIMPVFFCGHMSGVNWIPAWALTAQKPGRFPVHSQSAVKTSGIINFFGDAGLLAAQVYQIQIIGRALHGHPALYAYDLGNETSNCAIPASRVIARIWLKTLTEALREASPGAGITLGMHAEDLEEDRHLWPQDAAEFCDFLSMHAYPFYLKWVDDRLDYFLPVFLGLVTAWLGQKPVLLQEFGAPTLPFLTGPDSPAYHSDLACPLWNEERVADYYRHSLGLLAGAGIMGALAWCYADYVQELWSSPPLNFAPHERHFGLFHSDGTAKPAARIFRRREWSAGPRMGLGTGMPFLSREHFYLNPGRNLQAMYRDYKNACSKESIL